MKTMTQVSVATVGLLALLGGAGWVGLRTKPEPFPPRPERTRELGTAELPSDLPEPVHRHFQVALGEQAPRIETAVVWGRGDFNFNGPLWTHPRFKSYHVAGREFLRDQEITWFGMPILQGVDAYLGGKGSLEITGLLGLLSVSDSG